MGLILFPLIISIIVVPGVLIWDVEKRRKIKIIKDKPLTLYFFYIIILIINLIEITPLVFYSLYYQIYELFIIIFLVIIKIIMLLVLTNSNSKKNVQKRYITLNILIIITILYRNELDVREI